MASAIHFRMQRFAVLKLSHNSLRGLSSTTNNSLTYCFLNRRRILRVDGEDSVKLLQGIVTNNIELFSHDTAMKTMYCMMLNAQGRVLYDCILYKDKTIHIPGFLVECDHNAVGSLTKLLKLYKLRSKVNISTVNDVLPWVVFSNDQAEISVKDSVDLISIVKDPRLSELGYRLLLPQNISPPQVVQSVTEGQEGDYDIHRMKLGVSEGMEEIKHGVAFPLEYNLDYLHGVSFQKGCYIGQELTARTHHTGVIRKRIVPFTCNNPVSIRGAEYGTAIKTSSGKTSGKFCAMYGNQGTAIMRLAMISQDKHYVQDKEGNDVEVCPYIPKWWPSEE